MARVGRLAGAILAESGGDYYLIGNTKEPCDFAAAGFEPPAGEIDARRRPSVRLSRRAASPAPSLGQPLLAIALEGEPLARRLADALLLERTGSVSERLWRLLTDGPTDDLSTNDASPADPAGVPTGAIDARWLGEIPFAVWRVVRDAVLRCS